MRLLGRLPNSLAEIGSDGTKATCDNVRFSAAYESEADIGLAQRS
jgi:hypothetical protein